MFEDKTVENINKEMLDSIDDSYEKSVGNPTADIVKSFAIEEASIYAALKLIFDKINVDNLTGDELERYTKQRKGITRKPGNASIGVLTVNGTGTININDLFETASGVQFISLETKNITGTGSINIRAVTIGFSSNVPANTITQMPVTLAGITSVTNTAATYDGYDAETDDSLRQRYYEALRKPPTSANKYHYLAWAKEVTGVGGAIIFPTWNGDNTVKAVIVDDNKLPANSDLVSRTQAHIDPLNESNIPKGDGSGEAPIGAYCTVESATAKNIVIKVKVTKANANYTDDEIIANITNNVLLYFKGIALDEDNNYVSYAKIGNLIITSDGIADYDNSTFTINDSNTNIHLSLSATLCEVPVLTQVVLLP
ncbi:baseplate J/gp47 family protein [Clostridium magnum]|uniref:Baseplate J-like protein n=1 Tax=Clostridium magnum DSM 2767 TaxID=1121326 RepID=A0A168E1W3_9CLOT|nr:baseplate J/gp47 family protein [Clostridium magnum]KZL93563.1 baseplate J-like protein [Clostridium magnum DSM 2767]SHI60314.1 Uncharacterized phage protein gp47/JayE [Clostridium magnum DSM 2767]